MPAKWAGPLIKDLARDEAGRGGIIPGRNKRERESEEREVMEGNILGGAHVD